MPPGDEDALFAAMERLAGSADLRRALGDSAAAAVQANHRPRSVARAYVTFIRQVLESGPAYA